jgi:competence protein ComEC
LAALASYWPVAELWASASTIETGCGREVKASAPSFRPLAAGDHLRFGRWSIEVLWPPADSTDKGNEGSLVLRASAGGSSVLLTGDIEKGAERRLRAVADDLEAEVLKVAHHGSRSSSTGAFVAAVGASWAIVSAGEGNRFGHPAPEVLERLAEGGACRILRTDRHGLIRLHWPQARRPLRLELGGMPTAPHRPVRAL